MSALFLLTAKMEYLECTEGSSCKFWSCTITGSSTKVEYGKIGAQGQSQVKNHGTPDAAKKFAAKMKVHVLLATAYCCHVLLRAGVSRSKGRRV